MANIDEDLKKKIESTKFVYLVAKAGTGKTFSGDYLEVVRGWKHIDGDIPVKQQSSNPEWKDAWDQMFTLFMTEKNANGPMVNREYFDQKDDEWIHNECFKAYMKILADLTLEGARDSETVVMSHASYLIPQRIFLTQLLKDAGAKDVSTVFLHTDFDAHMQALWKRTTRQAEQMGKTIEEYGELMGVPNFDFDKFVEFQKLSYDVWEEPDESEQPYKVVDNTAKDVTVFDALDEAFGIDKNTSRGDLSYEEQILKIQAIDKKRDEAMIDGIQSKLERNAEEEMAEKEPEKLAARRSSLIELDKLTSSLHLSGRSSVLSSSSRRASFIKTGRFEE